MDHAEPMSTSEPPPGSGPTGAGRAPRYPVSLDLLGAACLVVGGGPVAARKVHGLLEAGAAVTVVALGVGPEVGALMNAGGDPADPLAGDTRVGSVSVEARPYRAGEAARYRLVVAATGVHAVDAGVVADAHEGGVLVNLASGRAPGTVELPAVHRAGPVTLTVSTAGASPALARWLRDRAAAALGPEIAALAALVEEARTSLQATGRASESVAWSEAIDRVAPLVAEGRTEEARALLARFLGAGPD